MGLMFFGVCAAVVRANEKFGPEKCKQKICGSDEATLKNMRMTYEKLIQDPKMQKARCGLKNGDCCGNAKLAREGTCNPGLICTPIYPSKYAPGKCMEHPSNQTPNISKPRFCMANGRRCHYNSSCCSGLCSY